MYALTESSKKLSINDMQKVKQKLSLDLKEHQITCIKAMLDLEQNNNINIDFNCKIYKNEIFTSIDNLYNTYNTWYLRDRTHNTNELKLENFNVKVNFGILADKVGAGKTYEIIGLICHTLVPPNHPKILSASYYSVVEHIDVSPTDKTNLLIVPHNLITQWKSALSLTNLKVFIVNKRNSVLEIRENDTENNTLPFYNAYDVILLSSTMIDVFYQKFSKVKWSRIIIDEITSIKLPMILELKSNFIWYITATPTGLRWIRKNYIREMIIGINKNIFNKIIIKNTDEYVSQSMKLPNINQVKIHCDTPSGYRVIQDFISKDILNMLNAGNIKEAVVKLNCNIDTDENILKILTKNIETSLHNKKAELVYLQTTIVVDQRSHNESIKKIEEQIASLNTRLISIEDKIKTMKEQTCPICLDDINVPALLPCCNNIFCVSCLTGIKNSRCPMCRGPFTSKNMHIISNDINNKIIKQKKLLTKENNLLKILNDNPNGKFLIFSNYEYTNDNISVLLRNNNISHSKLSGNSSCINKTIERFKNGTVSVLLLNARFFGSGLNLEMATDVIIYHEMDLEFETQVIGRAQRLGRTIPLNVYYLLHDNEKSNCVNPSLDVNIYEDDDSNIIES